MKRSMAFAAAIVMVMAVAPPVAAQEETVATVKSSTTVSGDGLRLLGRVNAPFTPRGEATVDDDCVADRRVDVSIRRARGYKMAGTDLTSATGRWSVRVRELGAVYRIRVQPSEFAYSPAYGELEIVRCRATTVIGTLRRRGFRIASVLGTRFGRAGVGRLPLTGSGVETYAAIAGLLIALGAGLLRSRPAGRTE